MIASNLYFGFRISHDLILITKQAMNGTEVDDPSDFRVGLPLDYLSFVDINFSIAENAPDSERARAVCGNVSRRSNRCRTNTRTDVMCCGIIA